MDEEKREDTTDSSKMTNTQPKKIPYVIITIAGIIIALLVATIIFLLVNKNSVSKDSTDNDSSQTEDNTDSNADSKKVIATNESTKSGLFVDLYQPKKVGNTLVVNYKIYNKDSAKRIYLDGEAGVYTQLFAKSPGLAVPEPYAVSDDNGKKYGLVKDDNGAILASSGFYTFLNKSESFSGYVTLSLPPSGSLLSISLGSMQPFTDVKVTY